MPRRGRSNPPPSERGRLISQASELAGDAPRLAEWPSDTAAGSLPGYVLAREDVRRKLRSTNAVERPQAEVWRRTRGIRIFHHEASLQRWLIAPPSSEGVPVATDHRSRPGARKDTEICT